MRTELVTTVKRKATELLSDLRRDGEPILITQHGLPSAYLVDVESFDRLRERMKQLTLEESQALLCLDRLRRVCEPRRSSAFQASVFALHTPKAHFAQLSPLRRTSVKHYLTLTLTDRCIIGVYL